MQDSESGETGRETVRKMNEAAFITDGLGSLTVPLDLPTYHAVRCYECRVCCRRASSFSTEF